MKNAIMIDFDILRFVMRCINIDWLEVHCLEPDNEVRDIAYYISKGYFAEDRGYGTRVYKEMFTIHMYGAPFIEIRRNPASAGGNGILRENDCHLRLVNRACYYNNAAALMEQFLNEHRYYNIRIKRIDLCLDFPKFDSGDIPRKFVDRYFKGKYSKINQCNIKGYGQDLWDGQVWNSLSWGSPKSQIYTKLYNKTQELYDIKKGTFKKPYILYGWYQCGFIDNMNTCTLNNELVEIWRLEFTIQSPNANWMKIDIDGDAKKPQSLQNKLETYNSKEKMFVIWASLSKHYFHFKYYQKGVRKDRCDDKQLFIFKEIEEFYHIYHDKYTLSEKPREENNWSELIRLLNKYKSEHYSFDIIEAYNMFMEDIEYHQRKKFLISPWDDKELKEFEQFLTDALFRKKQEYQANITNSKNELNIKKRTFDNFDKDEKAGE